MRKYTQTVKDLITAGKATSVYAVAKLAGIHYSQAKYEVAKLQASGDITSTWNKSFDFSTLDTKFSAVLKELFETNPTVSNSTICSAIGKSRLPKDVLDSINILEKKGLLTRNFTKIGQPVTYTYKG